MGEVIDITTWRHASTRGAPPSTTDPREGKALGRVLRAHGAWAREPEAKWLWSLLSQVVDAAPGDLAFSLDGLPLPPAVSAWLRRGQELLALPARALVRLWLIEVHHWRWRDREPAARAWVRAVHSAGHAADTAAIPAPPAEIAAWLDIAAERDGTTRDALTASFVASRPASDHAHAPLDDPRRLRQGR